MNFTDAATVRGTQTPTATLLLGHVAEVEGFNSTDAVRTPRRHKPRRDRQVGGRAGYTDIVPDLHVTITYSRTPVDWFEKGASWDHPEYQPHITISVTRMRRTSPTWSPTRARSYSGRTCSRKCLRFA